VSNSDAQDEATPTRAWQDLGDAPEEQPEEADAAPSWLGYPAESTEYTVPHTYASAGYTEGGTAEQYAPPTPSGDHAEPAHEPPRQYEAPPQYEVPPQDEAPPEMPAGAGLVPPRADARPPAPPAAYHPDAETGHRPDTEAGQHPDAGPNHRPAAPYPPTQAPWSQPAPRQRAAPPVPQPARERLSPPKRPPAAQVAPEDQPRPEDLLVPDRPSITDAPASWGWRGRVNRLSAGAIRPKAKSAELVHRQAVLDIQHGFSRPMTVVVIQPKGGAGKTPTTIGLAAALGAHRGGYVVGWDDNETRGTLAVRTVNRDSQRTTVWDFLGALPSFERLDARVGDLGYYVRSQGEAYFDALVSDDHPGNMAQIGGEEFRRIHAVLQRFYRIIVIDTGNNVRSPNWQAAINAADAVVIPSTYQRDVGYSGSWVLDHLLQTGREELAKHAVTVLTAADPTTDAKVRHELLRHFNARTEDVIEIPFDEHIAVGGPIHWANLAEETRRAYTQLGAVVVSALVQRD